MAGKIEKSTKPYAKDTIIIGEGQDASNEIFYLVKGQALAEIKGRVVGTVNAGQWFGEMAAILGTSRTATVRALTPCEVLVFKGLEDANLMDAMTRDPKLLTKLLETLAGRIRETSTRSVTSQEEMSTKLELYRKGISGTLYALEKLVEKYQSKVMSEVAEHLKGVSGLRMGDVKDTDAKYFATSKNIILG
jgi:CRP-like cAMP-binding protein